jgi:hypothetical protein
MNKLITIFLFVLVISTHSNAQSLFREGIDTPWVTGEITLTDGTLYKGIIQYRQEAALINFKTSEEAKESKSFTELKIQKLLLMDQNNSKPRIFYSFPIEVDGREHFLLFEILKEFKTWAVLSRKGTVNVIESRHDWVNTGLGYPAKRGYSTVQLTEGIYIFDNSGQVNLYLLLSDKESDGLFRGTSSKKKIVEKNSMQEKMDEHWDEVEEYAKENSLKFKNKEDLLKILDYYESLVENN